jgi:hypothetical protein
MMDRGLWISWYNLPNDGREGHLSWLYDSYIPGMLKKPGFLWGAHYASAKIKPGPHIRHTTDPAVPTGNDYVLMFGAETAHAFSKGTAAFTKGAPSKLDAHLTDADRKMLAMRIGERVCITTEEARADGPEARARGGKLTPAPCIQLGSFNDSTVAVEDELLSWYADWRMGALGNLPGCLGIRKMVSTSGWAKHLVLYEFLSLEERAKNLPKLNELYPDMIEWTTKAVPKLIHAPESPIVAQRSWPLVK